MSAKFLNSVVIMENEGVKVCLDVALGTNATKKWLNFYTVRLKGM